eukprot:m.6249 g.6249  ORF g.6249 m.6249 type:complete len:857 (+) comp3507_c0_seq1:162-2732(+)
MTPTKRFHFLLPSLYVLCLSFPKGGKAQSLLSPSAACDKVKGSSSMYWEVESGGPYCSGLEKFYSGAYDQADKGIVRLIGSSIRHLYKPSTELSCFVEASYIFYITLDGQKIVGKEDLLANTDMTMVRSGDCFRGRWYGDQETHVATIWATPHLSSLTTNVRNTKCREVTEGKIDIFWEQLQDDGEITYCKAIETFVRQTSDKSTEELSEDARLYGLVSLSGDKIINEKEDTVGGCDIGISDYEVHMYRDGLRMRVVEVSTSFTATRTADDECFVGDWVSSTGDTIHRAYIPAAPFLASIERDQINKKCKTIGEGALLWEYVKGSQGVCTGQESTDVNLTAVRETGHGIMKVTGSPGCLPRNTRTWRFALSADGLVLYGNRGGSQRFELTRKTDEDCFVGDATFGSDDIRRLYVGAEPYLSSIPKREEKCALIANSNNWVIESFSETYCVGVQINKIDSAVSDNKVTVIRFAEGSTDCPFPWSDKKYTLTKSISSDSTQNATFTLEFASHSNTLIRADENGCLYADFFYGTKKILNRIYLWSEHAMDSTTTTLSSLTTTTLSSITTTVTDTKTTSVTTITEESSSAPITAKTARASTSKVEMKSSVPDTESATSKVSPTTQNSQPRLTTSQQQTVTSHNSLSPTISTQTKTDKISETSIASSDFTQTWTVTKTSGEMQDSTSSESGGSYFLILGIACGIGVCLLAAAVVIIVIRRNKGRQERARIQARIQMNPVNSSLGHKATRNLNSPRKSKGTPTENTAHLYEEPSSRQSQIYDESSVDYEASYGDPSEDPYAEADYAIPDGELYEKRYVNGELDGDKRRYVNIVQYDVAEQQGGDYENLNATDPQIYQNESEF